MLGHKIQVANMGHTKGTEDSVKTLGGVDNSRLSSSVIQTDVAYTIAF